MTTKILVIEDAGDLREDVVETLNLEGFEALGAPDGVSGVEVALNFQPDLIVCDIMMPGLDGYGVLSHLRQVPHMSMVPFIFLTAKTDRTSQRDGMVSGADDYLTKPFLVNELLDSIQAQLDKNDRRQRTATRQLDDLRRNLTFALPHELRTPLNTIIGFSDMMTLDTQRVDPGKVREWGEYINGSAHRLYRLIENYLLYARLRVAQAHPPSDADRDITTGARMIIESQALRVAEKMDRLDDLALDIEDVPMMFIEYSDFIKALDEVLDNAFKFSEAGSEVLVTGRVIGDHYQVCVVDNGYGITPEQIRDIGAYTQFDRPFHEQQGLGLGLAIVKLMMEVYGGDLRITPRPNVGTQVCVRLKIG